MSDESILREQVRQQIRAGKLPSRSPDAMWGGPGDNASCGVCGVTLTPADVEMEVEFARPNGAGADVYHLHRRCMAAWELERHHFEPDRGISANGFAQSADAPTEAAP